MAFAATITVREHVLRTALQSGYANGSDTNKRFIEDLSDSALGMEPDFFFGEPDINCEGSTNLLVVTLPVWGTVKVTQSGVEHLVQVAGEMELTLTPDLRTGPPLADPKTAVELDPSTTTVIARRWTATVTSSGTPPAVAALITGNEFRTRFEAKFRQGVLFGKISLPSIDASFLGGIVNKATEAFGRVRNGVLLIGLTYVDEHHNLVGNPDDLQDIAGSNDVAGAVHKDAADIMLDEVHTKLVKGVEDEDASLDRFSVQPRDGYFYVSGAVSKSSGTVNFSFRVVPSMFHTRPGAYFQYVYKPRRVHSRTWPALDFRIEAVDTDVDRSWWVILFGEVIGGILTAGLSIIYVEGMVAAAASAFGGRIKSAKPGAPANRIRKTIPPPGAYPCVSDWTNSRSRMAASSLASPCGQLLRRRRCSDRRRCRPTTPSTASGTFCDRRPVSRAAIPRCGSTRNLGDFGSDVARRRTCVDSLQANGRQFSEHR